MGFFAYVMRVEGDDDFVNERDVLRDELGDAFGVLAGVRHAARTAVVKVQLRVDDEQYDLFRPRRDSLAALHARGVDVARVVNHGEWVEGANVELANDGGVGHHIDGAARHVAVDNGRVGERQALDVDVANHLAFDEHATNVEHVADERASLADNQARLGRRRHRALHLAINAQ